MKTGWWEISVQSKCCRFCLHLYLCSYTLKETHTLCPSSSPLSEMRISLFGSWMGHHSVGPCWRLLFDGLWLQRPFHGLSMPAYCFWGPFLASFDLSCKRFDQKEGQLVPICYQAPETWLTLQFRRWPGLSHRVEGKLEDSVAQLMDPYLWLDHERDIHESENLRCLDPCRWLCAPQTAHFS